jgi:hypothetical protein
MLSLLMLESIFSMRQKSPVCDEVSHHIATGYSFLKTGDFRLNSTSPPLTEELAAIPLIFLNPVLPLADSSWNAIDRVTFGYKFLYEYNKNAADLVFWARIPMVILSLLCALLVFIFAKEIYGEKAGLFAMFLYVFCPNIVAYSGLAIPDIGVTFFMLLAMYTFYRFLLKPTHRNVIFSGITLGFAEAAKYSALILFPVFFILIICKALADKQWKYILSLAGIIAVCYCVVFMSYRLEVKPLLKNDIDVKEKISFIEKGIDKVFGGNNQAIKSKAIDFALHTPIPFATYIMNILAETNLVFVKDFGVFLMGERSRSGWWYYYPVVFLLKTPIPLLLLLLLAILFCLKVKPVNIWAERLIMCFLALFTIACLLTKLQLSVRYILPLYPLLFIYISKITKVRIKKQFILVLAVSALSLWYVFDALKIYPNYLAYFNQFAGGPDNGWRYLRDANIDYGQDLPALARYLRKNNISKIKLSYFGTADPAYYGIKFEPLKEEEIIKPADSVYAISVNCIYGINWIEKIKPTAKAGYSIFIYDLRRK